MSHMVSARLQDELYKTLGQIAESQHRQFSEIIQEALSHYAAEYEDLQIAVERLKDPTDAVIGVDELRRRLKLST